MNIQDLNSGLQTAFVDFNVDSNLALRPQFISNNHREGTKVLSVVENELGKCSEFAIAVAFVTRSGIEPLLQVLKDLENRGVPGRILTTNYLTFSDPVSLRKLASLNNVELRMFDANSANTGFHPKGYIFRNDEMYHILVGSSNLTGAALTTNIEWNTRLVSTSSGEVAKKAISEFEQYWTSEYTYALDDFIDFYEQAYNIASKQRKIISQEKIVSLEDYKLKPNEMQVQFATELKHLVENGEKRALLISATGTGKTFASAFAVRELNPAKMLFIVHREQIAKQACKTFKRVFASTKSMGVLSGGSKDYECDFIFATMQMMGKDDVREKFSPDEFDVVVIDEVHHAGASSYQRIIDYFKPKLYLGMTASPERTDGFDIYDLFDHNIACEIRLQQALEDKLLCPFHYFGITDLTVDGKPVDEMSGFAKLICDDRVNYIIKQAGYFGYSGSRVKGLVFCSRNEEAKELSEKFNENGYRTIHLSGDNSQSEREAAVERLAKDTGDDLLDYIFTVDIFNEGIDVPEINQVIMLRPTESPVVFVQQLGRGLRKSDDKEFVVILDFIGNYTNNFMIPMALSGDRTYNRDNIRRYVREGSRVIPGESTIHFDEISKKRIFDSIDKMRAKKQLLAEKYNSLKMKLGRIPTIVDFYEYGEIDPMLFIEYSKTYDNFVRAVDKDYTVTFSNRESKMLQFVSDIVINGKRIHELLILKSLLETGQLNKENFIELLTSAGEKFKPQDYVSACNVLGMNFINSPADKKNYVGLEFISSAALENNYLRRTLIFSEGLSNARFKEELSVLVEYGLRKYRKEFSDHDEDNLVLYQKYSRKDVCRILNWEKDDSSTLYGYRIKYNTCPIFVTYSKQEDISESTKYEDRFINENLFSWMTRNQVSMDSTESQAIINSKENGLAIYLFIKKSDGEGSDFYYMGKVRPRTWEQKTIKNDAGKDLPIMNFIFKLEKEVRGDIYEYITT